MLYKLLAFYRYFRDIGFTRFAAIKLTISSYKAGVAIKRGGFRTPSPEEVFKDLREKWLNM